MAAQESSKAEECRAICQLRGVGAGAPLSLQLKAIDEEFHHLKGNQQSAKADHVQALFAWKSKQATQVYFVFVTVSTADSVIYYVYISRRTTTAAAIPPLALPLL